MPIILPGECTRGSQHQLWCLPRDSNEEGKKNLLQEVSQKGPILVAFHLFRMSSDQCVKNIDWCFSDVKSLQGLLYLTYSRKNSHSLPFFHLLLIWTQCFYLDFWEGVLGIAKRTLLSCITWDLQIRCPEDRRRMISFGKSIMQGKWWMEGKPSPDYKKYDERMGWINLSFCLWILFFNTFCWGFEDSDRYTDTLFHKEWRNNFHKGEKLEGWKN